MSKRIINRAAALFLAALSMFLWAAAESSWDSERLNLELSMQKRVEDVLEKILSPGEFVVVVHVDPIASLNDAPKPSQAPESDNGFYLPGVPTKKNYDASLERMESMVENMQPASQGFRHFIRRISATLVLEKGLSDDDVAKVRDITRQTLGLDATRGDTLDVQRSAFHKAVFDPLDRSAIFQLQKALRNYWLIISIALFLFCIAVFFLFMFGPLRGFLQHSVQVLSTLKPVEVSGVPSRVNQSDMQILPSLLAQGYTLPGPAYNAAPASFSGSLQVENPNRKTLPFGFIREDNLSNLALLLSRESPERAAVVLGYIPPDWISRVLSRMDQSMQTEVASHLATPRQMLPEQVEDIEQDLKRRLDYLIGGPERLMAIYETLDPDAQKRMLESLRDSRPDLADDLRSHTWFFDDIEKLEPAALKSLLREVDMPTLVASLRGAADSFKRRVLQNVTEGKAEILREEMELGDNTPSKAAADAQRKIIAVAKRLEREGQIHIPQTLPESAPATRYPSLKSSLKLPPGMRAGSSRAPDARDAEVVKPKTDLQAKIRDFLNKRIGENERFPTGDKDKSK